MVDEQQHPLELDQPNHMSSAHLGASSDAPAGPGRRVSRL